jgi:hypothetical protein
VETWWFASNGDEFHGVYYSKDLSEIEKFHISPTVLSTGRTALAASQLSEGPGVALVSCPLST